MISETRPEIERAKKGVVHTFREGMGQRISGHSSPAGRKEKGMTSCLINSFASRRPDQNGFSVKGEENLATAVLVKSWESPRGASLQDEEKRTRQAHSTVGVRGGGEDQR